MYRIPDHPAIRNAELTGYPDGREPAYPHCPVCGDECDTVYINGGNDIVGCDRCMKTEDAWGNESCFPEREPD